MYTNMVGVRPAGAHMEIRTQLSTNIVPILFGARVSVFYHTHNIITYNIIYYYYYSRGISRANEWKKKIYIFF